ncbi:MAG: hypothetical protein FJX35_22495 [Alphaproteobacteria bacterium]|nr:hypothetical protein [Alphaproteobacteria bacterium]
MIGILSRTGMRLRPIVRWLGPVIVSLPAAVMAVAASVSIASESAPPNLEGRWSVQERDNPNQIVQLPFLKTDKDYEMVITQKGAEITIVLPGDNVRFEPTHVKDNAINAVGRHPTRGAVNLRLTFDRTSYRLTGLATFQYELLDRKVDAFLPDDETRRRLADLQGRGQSIVVAKSAVEEEVARLQEALRASEARLAEVQRRASAAEQRVSELERNVAELGARRERDADRQMAQLRQERREQDVLIARLRNEITTAHDQNRAAIESAERKVVAIGNDLQSQRAEFENMRRALDEAKRSAQSTPCEPAPGNAPTTE